MPTVTIQATSSGKFLSVYEPADKTGLTVWKEDGSGRQKWVLQPSGGPDMYHVSVFKGRKAPTILGVGGDGVPKLTPAPPTHTFKFTQVNAAKRIFLIGTAGKFLTITPAGRVSLQPKLGVGQGAVTQQFKVLETGDQSPAAPKVFVGGAFQATQQDLAADPTGWQTVAKRCGYWAHPMGIAVAKDQGWLSTLLSRFGVKRYIYEMDEKAWSDGSNPIQTNTPQCWGTWLQQADPSFVCEFYAPWVFGDRLALQLDDVTNKLIQIRSKMDAAPGFAGKGYFFFAPPSPEALRHADTLLGARRNNMPFVEYVVRTAGLRGIAVDFPANLWRSASFPAEHGPGAADKARALTKQAYDIARRCNVPFCWVFNGSDSSIPATLDAIAAAGIKPDYVCVDNFSDKNRRGTPETNPATVTGQARTILAWIDGSL